MKVLHVIPSIGERTGGPAVVLGGLSRALVAAGVEVEVVSTTLSSPAFSSTITTGSSIADLNPSFTDISVRLFDIQRPRRWAYSPALSAYLAHRAGDFDVMHIHSLNLHTQWAAWKAARLSRMPVVVTLHAALDPVTMQTKHLRRMVQARLWQQSLLDHASILHFGTDAELAKASQYHSNPHTVVLPNGVFVEELTSTPDSPADRPQSLQLAVPTIVNHGRLSPKKGLDLLIRALPSIHRRVPEAQIILVGPDDEGYGDYLRDLAIELHVSSQVTMLGPLFGNELQAFLRLATVWVLPSRGDGSSMSLAEAMALGCPVVTTRFVDGALVPAENGALVLSELEPSQLAIAILDLLLNDVRRNQVRERGTQFASTLDWSRLIYRYVAVYEAASANYIR